MTNFEFVTYTEWNGAEYSTTTKVFDLAKVDPNWTGCHWDNPAIVASEQVIGQCMSDEMAAEISRLGAVEGSGEE